MSAVMDVVRKWGPGAVGEYDGFDALLAPLLAEIREAAAKDAAELERLRGFAEDYRTLCETLMGSHGGWLEEAQCHAEQHLDALEADS